MTRWLIFTKSVSEEFVNVQNLGSCLWFSPEQRFIQDPYATTFGGFSKVTNFFRAALRPPDSSAYSRSGQDPSLPPQADDEPGFELITCVREAKKQSCLQRSQSSNI